VKEIGVAAVYEVGSNAIHTYWDNSLSPCLAIVSGDIVVLDTLEASYGEVVRRAAEALSSDVAPDLATLITNSLYPSTSTSLQGHALTGPIYIDGAEPGDTLAIEILDIVPGLWGWSACDPGLIDTSDTKHVIKFWDLRDRTTAVFAPGIIIPLEPFCGVMGLAPAECGKHRTGPPRCSGGNMDIRQLTKGSTLYLPIQVPGGLFSVGDAHGAQGDGEVGGTGIEMDAKVTLRFILQKGRRINRPQLVTGGPIAPKTNTGPYFATVAHSPNLYKASREAVHDMLIHLEEKYNIERAYAFILASVCVDLRISQIVDAPNWTVSAFLPLSIFRDENIKALPNKVE